MKIEMENYEKKEVIKNFNVADKDIVKCSQYGKLHGFVHFSKKELNEKRTVTISGIGGAVNKAVSTAELLKKSIDLHQTNTIYFVTITEIWTPKNDQNLQNIEVERKVPAITIKLDIEEPANKTAGYQPPDLKSSPGKPIPRQQKFKKFNSRPKEKDDYPFPHHQKRLEDKFKPKKGRENGRMENWRKNDNNSRKNNNIQPQKENKNSLTATKAVKKNDEVTQSSLEQSRENDDLLN